jgi:hypothetical protein
MRARNLAALVPITVFTNRLLAVSEGPSDTTVTMPNTAISTSDAAVAMTAMVLTAAFKNFFLIMLPDLKLNDTAF